MAVPADPSPAPYPEQRLARDAAPVHGCEGPFALWHLSEDPSLGTFRPHTPATNPRGRAVGVGGRHPARADVLVPAGLPEGLHLAGVNDDVGGSGAVLRPERHDAGCT